MYHCTVLQGTLTITIILKQYNSFYEKKNSAMYENLITLEAEVG